MRLIFFKRFLETLLVLSKYYALYLLSNLVHTNGFGMDYGKQNILLNIVIYYVHGDNRINNDFFSITNKQINVKYFKILMVLNGN